MRFAQKKMTAGHENMKIAIVGYGRLGKVMARAFHAAGFAISVVFDKNVPDDPWLKSCGIPALNRLDERLKSARFILLSVPDGAIVQVAEHISRTGLCSQRAVVAHAAGSSPADILDAVRSVGALPLAWHPIQTFTGDENPGHLHGVTFGIDGDEEALQVGIDITERLGAGTVMIPPEKRTVYHLGCVFASNFIAALAGISSDLLRESGIDDALTHKALEPLMKSSLNNIAQKGLPGAITGPISREDHHTVGMHLEALANDPERREIYMLLSRELLKLTGKNSVGGISVDQPGSSPASLRSGGFSSIR